MILILLSEMILILLSEMILMRLNEEQYFLSPLPEK